MNSGAVFTSDPAVYSPYWNFSQQRFSNTSGAIQTATTQISVAVQPGNTFFYADLYNTDSGASGHSNTSTLIFSKSGNILVRIPLWINPVEYTANNFIRAGSALATESLQWIQPTNPPPSSNLSFLSNLSSPMIYVGYPLTGITGVNSAGKLVKSIPLAMNCDEITMQSVMDTSGLGASGSIWIMSLGAFSL